MRLCVVLLLATWPLLTTAETLLIKGGTVVNAEDEQRADVLVKDGKIAQVASGLKTPKGAVVVDANGKYVMPGGIDPHTHLEFLMGGRTGVDDFHSGHRAALAGGTTFHIDFVLPLEGDMMKGLKNYWDKASNALMDYGFHMAVLEWSDKVAKDMATVVEAGVNSFKFFFAYKGAFMVTDETYLKGLMRCKELGALPMIHAENGDAIEIMQGLLYNQGIRGPEGHSLSRPAFIEGEGTGRAVRLARLVNAPLYVVHVNSRDAALEIEAGLEAGQRLWGEALAGGIALTDEPCFSPDFKKAAAHVMSPPLRSKSHQVHLKQALASGKLQLIATDHCGWNSSQKAAGRHDFRAIPNGIHGIEERLHVAWEDLVNSDMISRSDFVRLTSTEAAKAFGIYPDKGVIAPGSDADIIILDPEKKHVLSAARHFSNIDTSVYEGKSIKGQVVTTISRGRIAFADGQIKLKAGAGRCSAAALAGVRRYMLYAPSSRAGLFGWRSR
ncbi:hypothetical protein WJX73_005198 [Symbiochloris irregularis]|uniref:dihydropyrimidinase n=1 Tax=Symbiochloris irregularis TaxID=706552 RepID=A0AAW1NPH8_9CHLO